MSPHHAHCSNSPAGLKSCRLRIVSVLLRAVGKRILYGINDTQFVVIFNFFADH